MIFLSRAEEGAVIFLCGLIAGFGGSRHDMVGMCGESHVSYIDPLRKPSMLLL